MTCVFCTMDPDRVLFSNGLAFAIYDGFPVSPGHMLIIPIRHVPEFFGATDDEKQALLDLLDQGKRFLDEKFHPDGYNIGINIGEAAGQTVMHLHIHLIPRYSGDVEDPKGGVRGVIPGKRKY